MACYCNNTKAAGRISGNPLNGLCERICIAVKKVFDGCERSFSGESFSLALSVVGLPPYSFIEARSNGATTVTNLTVTSTENARSRVSFTANVPVSVTYSDASGTTRSINTTLQISRDVLLRLPSEAVVPYEIEVATGLFANVGSINDSGLLSMTVCARQIVRVVADVEILVPSYGYCEYPECAEDGDASCLGLLQLPVFPD